MALNIPPGFNDGGNTTYAPIGNYPGAPVASVVVVGVLTVRLTVKEWNGDHPRWYRVSVTKQRRMEGAHHVQLQSAREFPTLPEAVTTYETWVEEERIRLALRLANLHLR